MLKITYSCHIISDINWLLKNLYPSPFLSLNLPPPPKNKNIFRVFPIYTHYFLFLPQASFRSIVPFFPLYEIFVRFLPPPPPLPLPRSLIRERRVQQGDNESPKQKSTKYIYKQWRDGTILPPLPSHRRVDYIR